MILLQRQRSHIRDRVAIDQTLSERNRLVANYNRSKRRELNDLLADPVYGPKLRSLRSTIANYKHQEDANRLLAYIEQQCVTWLRDAGAKWQYAALEAIDNHCIAVRVRSGEPEFDDPCGNGEENVFLASKRILGL